MVYRSDTRKRFAVVSPRYVPMQPRAVLEFFRELADTHGFQLETAGALKEGAIVWALASTDRKLDIGMGDIVKPYLLASTSYDGSQAHRWCFTTVRVVCNNTLRLSYAKDSQGVVTMRHVGKVNKHEVKRRLRLLDKQVEAFEAQANRLANFRLGRAGVDRLLTEVFGRQDQKGRLTAHSLSVIEDIKKAIDSSPGAELASASGTAWGVLNGVTRYIDFEARARSNDHRLTSAWFGRGDQLKREVMDRLLAMAA
jgi:phage/plasmid-like protein (TIGR03299 family)